MHEDTTEDAPDEDPADVLSAPSVVVKNPDESTGSNVDRTIKSSTTAAPAQQEPKPESVRSEVALRTTAVTAAPSRPIRF